LTAIRDGIPETREMQFSAAHSNVFPKQFSSDLPFVRDLDVLSHNVRRWDARQAHFPRENRGARNKLRELLLLCWCKWR
jgi:hypothetical protein